MEQYVLVIINYKGELENQIITRKEFESGAERKSGARRPGRDWQTHHFRANVSTDYRLTGKDGWGKFIRGEYHDGEGEVMNNLYVSLGVRKEILRRQKRSTKPTLSARMLISGRSVQVRSKTL